MKFVLVLIFILTIIENNTSGAIEILYVLPDNSTNAVSSSCPSQPCATLSQYMLDNGTLPVVSNVEYHFLPGEHHVPANMTLQNLHNLSITGTASNSSSPIVLFGCLQSYVLNIIDSEYVSIKNIMFKHCSGLPRSKLHLTNLRLSCCFSCRIQDIIFTEYGLTSYSLIGNSYLHNINIIQFSQSCCPVILWRYMICSSQNNYSDHLHNITINKIFIQGYTLYMVKLYIYLDHIMYRMMNISICNSYFYNTNQTALEIKARYTFTATQILVINCTFKFVSAGPSVKYLGFTIQ